MGWQIAIGVGVSVVALWLLMVITLVLIQPDRSRLREAPEVAVSNSRRACRGWRTTDGE